jgi:hypothetical protein
MDMEKTLIQYVAMHCGSISAEKPGVVGAV